MKKLFAISCVCIACAGTLGSCKKENKKNAPSFTPPKYTGRVDNSVEPAFVDLETALDNERKPLKLSRIASEIAYYVVGDGSYGVTQAIAVPGKDAFITFNNPRIYYRKKGHPSKRYGFKALAYKWNNEMNGQNLFYDKKSTRMYCALSGKNQNNKDNPEIHYPQIAELPPLNTMLRITRYIFPETVEKKYSIHRRNDKLIGFCSEGYMLSHYENSSGIPNSVSTFNLDGETLSRFELKEKSQLTRADVEAVPFFQTSYWNAAQDRMTFMIPFCDTVFQLRDAQTVVPLYHIHCGKYGIFTDYTGTKEINDGKIWLRTLYENPEALFIGICQKNGPKLLNWLRKEYEYKPTLSYQAVYLKKEGKTYVLPYRDQGFINDLDDGFSFWPDGQTDEYLYMIRPITEMRARIERTGSPKQKKLLELLDNTAIQENQYVMIVVK